MTIHYRPGKLVSETFLPEDSDVEKVQGTRKPVGQNPMKIRQRRLEAPSLTVQDYVFDFKAPLVATMKIYLRS